MIGNAFPVRYGCRDRDPANRRRAAARPGAGDGVDLNLTADGIVLQRAFGEAPNRVKSLSCIKNIYGLGLLFFSTSYAASGDAAGRREAAGRDHLEDFPGADRALHFAHHRAVLFIALVNVAAHFGHGSDRQRRRRLVQLLAQWLRRCSRRCFSLSSGVNRLAWMRVCLV